MLECDFDVHTHTHTAHRNGLFSRSSFAEYRRIFYNTILRAVLFFVTFRCWFCFVIWVSWCARACIANLCNVRRRRWWWFPFWLLECIQLTLIQYVVRMRMHFDTQTDKSQMYMWMTLGNIDCLCLSDACGSPMSCTVHFQSICVTLLYRAFVQLTK